MAVIFEYTLPDISADPGKTPVTRRLYIRNDPNEVDWTYNLNTQVYDTYGGQVIQILSVNIDSVVVSGTIGREGPFGVRRMKSGGGRDSRYGGPVPGGGWDTRGISSQFDYDTNYPGLHSMVEFFREYFAVVTQGGDDQNPGKFTQTPMTLTYGGATSHEERAWTITPISFPSFRRSNEDFAPEWRVEAKVIEADRSIVIKEKEAAISRLQEAIGYKVRNPFSDPLADPSTDAVAYTDHLVSEFKALLPKFTTGEIADMAWQNISMPTAESQPRFPVQLPTGEVLQGEIGNSTSKTTTGTNANGSNGPRSAQDQQGNG